MTRMGSRGVPMHATTVRHAPRYDLSTSGSILAMLVCTMSTQADVQAGLYHISGIPGIESIEVSSTLGSYQSGVDRDLTGPPEIQATAYDYSVHLMYDTSASLYRMFWCGRWFDPTIASPCGSCKDGDHTLSASSGTGAPDSWMMAPAGPLVPQGHEEGACHSWYSLNYCDPEVVKVTGVYYMFTQVSIPWVWVAGGACLSCPADTCESCPFAPDLCCCHWPIDQPPGALTASYDCDRIQLHTSVDGTSWTRASTLRGVVANLTDPESTMLHHPEVVHVPWDGDGRPWWLYVNSIVGTAGSQAWRIRSADPTTFDWHLREQNHLAGDVGGQVGYALEIPGGPLFIKIDTLGPGPTGRRDPLIFVSDDGLLWRGGDEGIMWLQGTGSDAPPTNINSYFAGLSSIDGAGRLQTTGISQFGAPYAVTTSASNGRGDIYFSEIAVGAVTIKINKPANYPDTWADSSWTGFEAGTVRLPWNTVIEAVSAVPLSGIVALKRGHYSGAHILDKACTIRAEGGTVTIGGAP